MAKRNTELIFLIGYLLIFGALFLIALFDYNKGKTMLDMGFDPALTNIMIMTLSFVGLLKSIYHLYIFETK